MLNFRKIFEHKPLDVSPFFSEDIQIKENQEKAEEFKIQFFLYLDHSVPELFFQLLLKERI